MEQFVPFVQAVGRGEKLKRDLTRDEAQEAMRLILTEQAAPAQVGAFLVAQRVKGESADEVVGFTRAVRDLCHRINPQGWIVQEPEGSIECPPGRATRVLPADPEAEPLIVDTQALGFDSQGDTPSINAGHSTEFVVLPRRWVQGG
jgi:hypothetical protein